MECTIVGANSNDVRVDHNHCINNHHCVLSPFTAAVHHKHTKKGLVSLSRSSFARVLYALYFWPFILSAHRQARHHHP